MSQQFARPSYLDYLTGPTHPNRKVGLARLNGSPRPTNLCLWLGTFNLTHPVSIVNPGWPVLNVSLGRPILTFGLGRLVSTFDLSRPKTTSFDL